MIGKPAGHFSNDWKSMPGTPRILASNADSSLGDAAGLDSARYRLRFELLP